MRAELRSMSRKQTSRGSRNYRACKKSFRRSPASSLRATLKTARLFPRIAQLKVRNSFASPASTPCLFMSTSPRRTRLGSLSAKTRGCMSEKFQITPSMQEWWGPVAVLSRCRAPLLTEVQVANADGQLFPGMNAEVRFAPNRAVASTAHALLRSPFTYMKVFILPKSLQSL